VRRGRICANSGQSQYDDLVEELAPVRMPEAITRQRLLLGLDGLVLVNTYALGSLATYSVALVALACLAAMLSFPREFSQICPPWGRTVLLALIAFRHNEEDVLPDQPISRTQMVECLALNERLDALQNLQVQASQLIPDDVALSKLDLAIEQCTHMEIQQAQQRAGCELPEFIRVFHGTREALLDEPASRNQSSWERYTSALSRAVKDIELAWVWSVASAAGAIVLFTGSYVMPSIDALLNSVHIRVYECIFYPTSIFVLLSGLRYGRNPTKDERGGYFALLGIALLGFTLIYTYVGKASIHSHSRKRTSQTKTASESCWVSLLRLQAKPLLCSAAPTA